MGSYKISSLSPVRFHQSGRGDFAYNLIPHFEYLRGYCQKYCHGDQPYIQILTSDAGAVMKMDVINNAGTIFATWAVYDTGELLYNEKVYAWDGIIPEAATTPEGLYFLKLTISDADGSAVFYSEPIYICASWTDLVTVAYWHDENDFDRKFAGNGYLIQPSMVRIEGGMKSNDFTPGGKFKMFQDLDYNSVVLNSSPYNVEKWTFGPSPGTPNHVGDLLNRIFGLAYVTIDGVYYSRNEGAKMERIGDAEYPLAGWAIDLIKTENPYSELFQTSYNGLTCDNTAVTCDNSVLTCDATKI